MRNATCHGQLGRTYFCGDAGRGGKPLPQFVDKGRLRGPLSTGHVSPAPGARPGKRAGKPCCARLPNPPRMSPGSDCLWRASALQASPKGFFDGLRPAQTTFQRIDKWNTLLRGCRKGRQAPSYLIRSGGVYTARSGCKPLPLSCSARALCAQEHNVPFAARLRNSLAAKDRDFVTVFPGAAAYTLLYRNGRPTFSCRVLFKPRSPRVYYEWTPWRQARTRTQGESARKQEEAEG